MRHKKQNVTDTIKDIPKDPKDALQDDYEQTKADMKNMKDAAVDKAKEMTEGDQR